MPNCKGSQLAMEHELKFSSAYTEVPNNDIFILTCLNVLVFSLFFFFNCSHRMDGYPSFKVI